MFVIIKKWFAGLNRYVRPFKKRNRYTFLKRIGQGGLAKVSKYFDPFLYRLLAVKELKPDREKNKNLRRSFITEMRLLGYLDHPGIVPIYDTFVKSDNRLRYGMKLIDGATLTKVLQSGKQFTIHKYLDVFRKICDTLAYVHDKGVIHLDVKPDNVLIGRYGEVMVMDWGNARLYKPEIYFNHFKNQMGNISLKPFEEEADNMVLGTPNYMSPEQTNTPRKYLTPSSDIFSAGIILYEMLTGIQPFGGITKTAEVVEQIRTTSPKTPHTINRDIPLRISMICEKMIHKKQEKRYQSFRDVITDIDEFLNSGQAFKTKEFAPGAIIVAEGDHGEFAFAIVSGKVKVSKRVNGEEKTLATLGHNEIVGELSVFSEQPRVATVTAIERTVIRVMDKPSVDKELEKLSPWVGTMISALATRFASLNEKVAQMDQSKQLE